MIQTEPSRLNGAGRILLLGTLFCAPLVFGAVEEWAWGSLAVIAFVLVLLWSVAGARQGALRISWSPLYLPAGAFLLLAAVQYFCHFTLDPLGSREALLKLATSLIIFFLAGQLMRGVSPFPIRLSRVLSPVALIPVYTLALSVFAIFQFFSSPNLIYGMVKSEGWVFGPYVNHNHYAGLMEMLIPLTAAGLLHALDHRSTASLFAIFVLIPVASLFLSGSRGGVVSLALEALLGALLISFYGPTQARKTAAWLGGLAIAAALLFIWMAPQRIVDRLTTMTDEIHSPDTALVDRLVVSRDSLHMFKAHLWQGVGLGAFETAFPQFQSFSSDLTWDHAHNDYAEAVAETGLGGGMVIVSALGMFLGLAFRNLHQRLAQRSGWLPFAASLGCCGMLLHSVADFNFRIPANAAWFAFSAALATLPTQGNESVCFS